MREVLEYLHEIDLSAQAIYFWEALENADPCVGGLLVAVLVCLGHKIASGNRTLYGLGLRLAVLTFLIHGGWAVFKAGGFSGLSWTTQVPRSGLIAGWVLALSWIILPLALFVFRYFRVALAAFLLYGGYGLVMAQSYGKETLTEILFRSLGVAGLSIIGAWILQPVWDLLGQFRKKPTPETQGEKPSDLVPSKKEHRRWRRWIFLLARSAAPAGGIHLEALKEADEEKRRRRDKARLLAELAYMMAMPDISAQFPRDMLESWMQRYLGDHLPPEEVEENSRHVQMIISRHQKQLQGPGTNLSLEEVHFWFLEEQKRIQSLEHDTPARQNKLLTLQEMYVSLSQRFLSDPPVVPMRKDLTVFTAETLAVTARAEGE